MIAFIIKIVMGGLWKPILKVLAIFGAYGKGRVDQAGREKLKDLKAEKETHARINTVDTGAGLTDQQRADRLRDIGKQLGG